MKGISLVFVAVAVLAAVERATPQQQVLSVDDTEPKQQVLSVDDTEPTGVCDAIANVVEEVGVTVGNIAGDVENACRQVVQDTVDCSALAKLVETAATSVDGISVTVRKTCLKLLEGLLPAPKKGYEARMAIRKNRWRRHRGFSSEDFDN